MDINRIIEADLEPVYRAKRPPTENELLMIASAVFEESDRLMSEDPRGWDNYEAMVGFQVGRAVSYHRLSDRQYRDLVALVMAELKVRLDRILQEAITGTKWMSNEELAS